MEKDKNTASWTPIWIYFPSTFLVDVFRFIPFS